MAYDLALGERIARLLKYRKRIVQKQMFGGVCFMLNGHMCCGVAGKKLMVRVGPARYEAALCRPHARPMDITGRPLRGFIFVLPPGTSTQPSLKAWLELGFTYANSLPAKPSRRP